jgi:hypothetical protein
MDKIQKVGTHDLNGIAEVLPCYSYGFSLILNRCLTWRITYLFQNFLRLNNYHYIEIILLLGKKILRDSRK